MAPRKNKATGIDVGSSNDIKSSGAPSADSNAVAVSTLEAAGSAASQPGDTGQSSGTNTSEESATVEIGAGDTAGPVTGVTTFNPRAEVLRITHLNQLQNLSEQVDEERHPRVVAFFQSEVFSEDEPPSAILVTCEVAGFRRAGHRHPAGTEPYTLDHFTADQLEQLLGDATFTVELV